ncbi:MAG: YadA-like family protein, partial [Burkholderiaceae bacterium]|jgi:autotransporter adhesin|nr:YadA-like family protein [Burkholderiaceae bacterium]
MYDDSTHTSLTLGRSGTPVLLSNVANGTVSATSTDAINGSQLYATNQSLAKVTSTVESPITFAGNSGSTEVALGGTLKISGGNATAGAYSSANVNTTVDADGVHIQMAENPQFTSVITGSTTMDNTGVSINGGVASGGVTLNNTGLKIASGPSVTTGGINAANLKISNLADGTANGDAVNLGQLNSATQALTNSLGDKPMTFAGNSGNTEVALGDTLKISGGNATAGAYSSANINTTVDSDGVHIQMAENPEFTSVITGSTTVDNAGVSINGGVASGGVTLNSSGLKIASGPSVTSSGINAASLKISNLANGTANGDAVNLGQLNSATQTLTDSLSSLSNLGGTPMSFAGNSGTTQVALGNTLKISGGNATTGAYSGANVNTTVDSDGIHIQIAENPEFTSVRTGSTTMDSTGVSINGGVANGGVTLNNTGLSIAGGPSVTSSGIDAANLKISHLANGEVSANSTDAINGSQLYAVTQSVDSLVSGTPITYAGNTGSTQVAQGDTLKITGDKSTAGTYSGANINTTVDSDGVHIQIAENPVFNSVITGNTTVDSTGVSISGGVAHGGVTLNNTGLMIAGGPSMTVSGISAGNQTITNVAAGLNGTDAVNVNQLDRAMSTLSNEMLSLGDSVSNILGGGAKVTPDAGAGSSSSASPTYTVGGQTYNDVGSAINALDAKPASAGTPYFGVNTGGKQGGNFNGDGAAATGSMALGADAAASGANSTALGNGATVSGSNSVALGANSVATGSNTVSVGAPGSERTISNVATGVKGTDAVNVNQLASAISAVSYYTTYNFQALQNAIKHESARAYAGVAGAMAMPNQMPSAPGKTVVSTGAAGFGGEGAVGVGVTHRSDNGSWLLNGAVSSTTQGDTGVRVQVGYEF